MLSDNWEEKCKIREPELLLDLNYLPEFHLVRQDGQIMIWVASKASCEFAASTLYQHFSKINTWLYVLFLKFDPQTLPRVTTN